jgi:SPP1 family predicted phage head-tail adaptor
MATTTKDPCSLPSGDLRHSITILGPTLTTDTTGNVITYSPFLTDVRAKIDPVSGLELIRSGQDISMLYITVSIRYVPGITAKMQVQAYHGLYWIRYVENVLERNRVLKLMCTAVDGNQ